MTKNERTKAYNRTKRGICRRIYNHMLERSKKRGHRPPEFSREELEDWIYSHTHFHEMFSEWEQSGYVKYLKPSIDRKDDNLHYFFKNMRIVTWFENNRKARDDVISGKLKSTNVSVIQLTKDDEFIKEHHSISAAARYVGGNHRAISECLSGRTKTSAGFKWIKKQNKTGAK